MTDRLETDPQDESGTSSSWSLLAGALMSPPQAFAGLGRRPAFALCLLVLLLAGMVFGYVAMGKVTPRSFVESIEAQGRTVPPSVQEDPASFLAKMRKIQIGAGTAVALLFYLLAAAIFLAAFRLLGSDLTYRQSLATTVHGLLPLAIAALVGLAVVAGRDEVSLGDLQSGSLVLSNLSFLAGDHTSKALRALLASVDVFSIWSAALLATGYRIVARVSSGAAWSVVSVLWAVAVGLKVAMAAIF